MNNKSIRQNWKIFNMIRFQPLDFEVPPEGSQQWSEEKWNYIIDAPLIRHACYINKSKSFKYNITLWSDDNFIYLIEVIRTEFNTDNTLVYMATKTNDNLNDLKAIAKFIHTNIRNIINESINNVQEFHKLRAIQEEQRPNGDA